MFGYTQKSAFGNPRRCYAVDMQGDLPVAVRAERSGGRIEFAAIPSDDQDFRNAMRQGVPCVAALTAKESFTRWMEAPFASFRKAARVMPALLDVELPFDLDECVYSFVRMRRTDRRTTRALAVAARRQEIGARLSALKAHGIDPVSLDQEGIALWTQALREFDVEDWNAAPIRAVLYAGADRLTLAIGRGREFLASHSARPGDVAHALRLVKTYQTVPAAQVSWVLAGPLAGVAERAAAIKKDIAGEWSGDVRIAAEPAAFLARALAERMLSPTDMPCNFRAGDLEHPALVARRRKTFAANGLISLAAGLTLCAANVAAQISAAAKEEAIDARFAAVAGELAGYDIGPAKGKHAIMKVREKVNRRLDASRPFLDAFKPSLAALAEDIARIAGRQDLHLSMLSVDRKKLIVSGTSTSWEKPEELASFLERRGYKARLERKDALADERIPFAITTGDSND